MTTRFENEFGRLSPGKLPGRKNGIGLYDAQGGTTRLVLEVDGDDFGVFDTRTGDEIGKLIKDGSGHAIQLKGSKETIALPHAEAVKPQASAADRLYPAAREQKGNTLLT